jgi:hypothetical protein
LIALPYESVNEALSGAWPDGSIMRTNEPSGSVYCMPGEVVGELGKPASWKPPARLARLVEEAAEAIPLLVSWIPRVEDLSVKEMLVRAVTDPAARRIAGPTLAIAGIDRTSAKAQ